MYKEQSQHSCPPNPTPYFKLKFREPISGELLRGNLSQLTSAYSLICAIPFLSLYVRIFLCMYSYSLTTYLSHLFWKTIKFSGHKSGLISTRYFQFWLQRWASVCTQEMPLTYLQGLEILCIDFRIPCLTVLNSLNNFLQLLKKCISVDEKKII